jgi:hypothetical protein
MTNRFMISVAAAALIAGAGYANAQGTGTSREAPSAVQQNAPSSDHAAPSSATPTNRNDASETSAPSEKMQPPGSKNQRAQDDMKGGAKGQKSAQDTDTKSNMKGEKSKSMSSETNEKGAVGKDRKAEGRNGNMNAESKGAEENKSQTTVGQAGAGAKLSTEQRTKISTVIKGQNIRPANNVNFSISVGTHVPKNFEFHPLPVEIVSIYPRWRGYEMFLVGDQVVVVNPRTLEIVAVLDV